MVSVTDSIATWEGINKIKKRRTESPAETKSELPRESSDLERKKETADVERSRQFPPTSI